MLTVRPLEKLGTAIEVPGDKSCSHRAAILAGLADGVSEVKGFLPSEDCLCTLKAMMQLGVQVEEVNSTCWGPIDLRITGTNMKLTAPTGDLDCGNSGTGMRLLAGVLAAQGFESRLIGDDSLQSRPMGRVTVPLESMGAKFESEGEKPGCAPLRISGGSLKSIRYEMPVASAQVKSSILLAGLFAEGETTVVQPAVTRDHTERMFADFGIECKVDGNSISVKGGQNPQAADLQVPGDFSSAAFWLVAAAAHPGSELRINTVGLNPTRTALMTVLERMGAQFEIEELGSNGGEPIGNILVKGKGLKGTEILEEEVPNLIDEVPILAIAAALAEGTTTIRNAEELRVKETDRIMAVVDNLKRIGVSVEEFQDGMVIEGGNPLKGAEIESYGDHRIAMAFAIAGLFLSEGEIDIQNSKCIATSYPGFRDALNTMRTGGEVKIL
ncbi:3-phosphoshikimate 1-carboxyvinyltransferase [Roseibacillus persicicus]|uniref:3-phosphoshikimate 1-carboxyvinyltransferase n=1 Tax=Roseibacillus persicicus TaxID=454148 RepID=A0A918TGG4_9BACT|nr:3-phosphoshikimate 1-carboxyvinyltransferase [Roseibacillus persicicus]GHC48122.1 3-phosphoshikimate 1-carboxyvinyltransferase [Roseibacillus persicicus]